MHAAALWLSSGFHGQLFLSPGRGASRRSLLVCQGLFLALDTSFYQSLCAAWAETCVRRKSASLSVVVRDEKVLDFIDYPARHISQAAIFWSVHGRYRYAHQAIV